MPQGKRLKPTLCNEQLPNGLVIPSTPKEKEEKLPLEIWDEEDRKKVEQSLARILTTISGAFIGEYSKQKHKAQVALILSVAKQLLGKDEVEHEEYC